MASSTSPSTATVVTATTPTVAVLVGTSAHEISERMHQRIDLNDATTNTSSNSGVMKSNSSSSSSNNSTTLSSAKESSQPKRTYDVRFAKSCDIFTFTGTYLYLLIQPFLSILKNKSGISIEKFPFGGCRWYLCCCSGSSI